MHNCWYSNAFGFFDYMPSGSHRATRCAGMHRARNDPSRACGMDTSPPSTARAARRACVAASRQVSPADTHGCPPGCPRSGTASPCGTPRGRLHRGQRHQGSRGPRDARPTRVVILAPPDEGLAPRDAPRQRWRAPGVVSHKKEAYSQETPLASHKSPAPLWHVRGVHLRATAEAGDGAMARCATRSGGCALP
jgi:hypothetical protein